MDPLTKLAATMECNEAVRPPKEHAAVVLEGKQPTVEKGWFDDLTSA
jgi:hypothetical protein